MWGIVVADVILVLGTVVICFEFGIAVAVITVVIVVVVVVVIVGVILAIAVDDVAVVVVVVFVVFVVIVVIASFESIVILEAEFSRRKKETNKKDATAFRCGFPFRPKIRIFLCRCSIAELPASLNLALRVSKHYYKLKSSSAIKLGTRDTRQACKEVEQRRLQPDQK